MEKDAPKKEKVQIQPPPPMMINPSEVAEDLAATVGDLAKRNSILIVKCNKLGEINKYWEQRALKAEAELEGEK